MSDTLPPLTVDELVDILKNPNFKTYVVLGAAGDKAWKLALAAQNFVPGLRSYLIKSAAQKEARARFGVTARTVGVVFGRNDNVYETFTKAKAEDFLTVMQTIAEAT